jgi:hypothetical protein
MRLVQPGSVYMTAPPANGEPSAIGMQRSEPSEASP